MNALETLALLPWVILASALICQRWPIGATVTAFAISGVYGSVQAFTGFSPVVLVDVILAGLWASLIISRFGASRAPTVIWLSTVAIGIYVALTILALFFSDNIAGSLQSFRLSAWYLLALMLMAYAGWSARTYMSIARGFVFVAALVGAYAGLRWQIGPADPERTLALQSAGAYNFVEGQLRVFGSFNSGHQLGFWAGVIAPFCLAAMLGWRGRWRVVAGGAFGLLVFAVLVSEVRAAFVAVVLGSSVVLVLFQLARSMPGLHLGRTATIAATCAALLAGGLLFTVGATDRLDRYTAILSPSEDPAYASRERKWEEAADYIEKHPFGQGIGSASRNPAARGPYRSPASYSLDSSYLKIAFEQGFAVMVLFVLALAFLLAQLVISSVRAIRPEAAAMGMGAAGALVATMVSFYSGSQVESAMSLASWLAIGLGIGFLASEAAAGQPAVEPDVSEDQDISSPPVTPREALPPRFSQHAG